MHLLSFDIEDWYMSYTSSQLPVAKWPVMPSRIAHNLDIILGFLEEKHQIATFYIMGWVAENNPETVKKIAAAGHEIGYHSYYHELPVHQGPEAFEADLVKGLAVLEHIIGRKVTQYRAPRFSFDRHTAWAIPILLRHGITLSSSMMSGRPLGTATSPQSPFIWVHEGQQILEMPLNRATTLGVPWVYTGSGFFRIFPYPLIKMMYAANAYNMAYFHPRDFDPDVPATNLLPFYRNIMSRLGNSTTIPKLSKLMQHHTFVSVGQAASELNTTKLRHIHTP
jgi:peptidoglycan-N-acetylglucosamine deacetylase